MQVAGAEVLVSQIIERTTSLVEPTIFCLDRIGQLGEELAQKGLPVVVLGRKEGIDIALSQRYAKELQDRRIDVVHAHQYTPFFYTALARLRGAKSKILLTEHGRHYPDVVSAKRRWANRWLLSRFANHSTACCKFSAIALEKLDGFKNVEVVYNGIDIQHHPLRCTGTERLSLRAKLGLSQEKKYIVCIARFHPVKDHSTLVRAFAHLATKNKEADLILVGTGPDEEKIRELAAQSGVSDRVHFWGVRRDVSDILQAADVFSLTSVSEAASLTLLEAMANGCPVAVTDVGGNGEHVTHGEHGLLSPRGDVERLSNNLQSLLQSPEQAAAYANSARKRVEQEFRLEQAVTRYVQLFQSLAPQ